MAKSSLVDNASLPEIVTVRTRTKSFSNALKGISLRRKPRLDDSADQTLLMQIEHEAEHASPVSTHQSDGFVQLMRVTREMSPEEVRAAGEEEGRRREDEGQGQCAV